MTTTDIHPDTVMWKIEHDGRFVACGSSASYPEGWADAMFASNRFLDWSYTTDAEDDIATQWQDNVGPTCHVIAGFTITTGPVNNVDEAEA